MGYDFEIEIDGGVKTDNVRETVESGVDIVVAGSAIFGSESISAGTEEFLKIIK